MCHSLLGRRTAFLSDASSVMPPSSEDASSEDASSEDASSEDVGGCLVGGSGLGGCRVGGGLFGRRRAGAGARPVLGAGCLTVEPVGATFCAEESAGLN